MKTVNAYFYVECGYMEIFFLFFKYKLINQMNTFNTFSVQKGSFPRTSVTTGEFLYSFWYSIDDFAP